MEFNIQGIVDGKVYFELPSYALKNSNGPSRIAEYRTDGKEVERKDGATWHATGSLPVVLIAREAFKLAGIKS